VNPSFVRGNNTNADCTSVEKIDQTIESDEEFKNQYNVGKKLKNKKRSVEDEHETEYKKYLKTQTKTSEAVYECMKSMTRYFNEKTGHVPSSNETNKLSVDEK